MMRMNVVVVVFVLLVVVDAVVHYDIAWSFVNYFVILAISIENSLDLVHILFVVVAAAVVVAAVVVVVDIVVDDDVAAVVIVANAVVAFDIPLPQCY